jgi:hypothetical protein
MRKLQIILSGKKIIGEIDVEVTDEKISFKENDVFEILEKYFGCHVAIPHDMGWGGPGKIFFICKIRVLTDEPYYDFIHLKEK